MSRWRMPAVLRHITTVGWEDLHIQLKLQKGFKKGEYSFLKLEICQDTRGVVFPSLPIATESTIAADLCAF